MNLLKNYNKFLLIFGLILFFFLVKVLPPIIQTSVNYAKHYYYFNINPKAEAAILEKQYKDIFDSNQKVFEQSNQAITDLQAGKDSAYTVEQQLLVNLNQRDFYYNQLIKIDNQALKLNLPSVYKDFFKLRVLADKKDYDGFKAYRDGINVYFTASNALQNYNEAYREFFDQVKKLDISKYSQDQVDIVKYHVKLFEGSYQNIAGIADTTDIFNQEILKYIQNMYHIYGFTKDYVNAYEDKDSNKMNESFYGMTNYLNNNPTQDINAIISRWGTEKLGPYNKKQDELHNSATDLYHKAYDYARKQKLQEILPVWSSETPGYVENMNPRSI